MLLHNDFCINGERSINFINDEPITNKYPFGEVGLDFIVSGNQSIAMLIVLLCYLAEMGATAYKLATSLTE